MQVDRRLRKLSAHRFNLTVPALALVMAAVYTACGTVPTDGSVADMDAELLAQPRSPIAALADPNVGLTFAGTQSFASGQLTLGLTSGDTVILSRSAANGNITINGNATLGATVTNTNSITVTYSVNGPQNLIIDYINGLFATGSKAHATNGVFLNTQGNVNDTLAVRLPNPSPAVAGNVVFSETDADINNDSVPDINFTATGTGFIPTIIVELGAGNDQFTGAGGQFYGNGNVFSAPVGTTQDTNSLAYTRLIVYGAAGNDNIICGKGNDILHGGPGNDWFSSGSIAAGAVSFYGDNGNDSLTFASRTSNLTLVINGNAVSGALNENITIGTDIEALTGGSGDDTLSGSPNTGVRVTLSGGPGNDAFVQTGAQGDSNDIIIGGAGTDTVDYTVRGCNANVTLEGTANDGCPGENDNVGTDVENIRTGIGSDYIVGSSGNNIIFGGTGTNYLSGGAGDDTFDQGTSSYNTGIDTIVGGAGEDVVDYSGRTAAVTVALDGNTPSGETSDNDKIAIDVEDGIGGTGADTLIGNIDDNTLNGGPGTDTVSDCGGGSDIVLNCEALTGAAVSNCGITLP